MDLTRNYQETYKNEIKRKKKHLKNFKVQNKLLI